MRTFGVLAILIFVGLGIVAYALFGRAGSDVSTSPPRPSLSVPVGQLAKMEPVKNINLDYHQPDLPPGPGHDLFAAQCVVCHSPRYVVDQPVFPRKTWTAEVKKMVDSYGAMITPDQQKEIVDYLVYWHGKEDAPPAPAQETK
jgi:sulfite dehydrogenase (cytochrome) subunit B